MLTPADITENGERHVEAWLAANSYHCNPGRARNGVVDIEARGEEESLIVLVKAALAPSPVPEPSTLERGRAVSRAMTLGCDAWLAQVNIGRQGELVGEIQWRQLNH